MYNQERKERYIAYVKNDLGTVMSPKYLETKFNNTAPYELSYGKDLCDFTAYEITEMYNRIGMRSLNTYIVLNSLLALYTDWCMKEGLVKDQINHYRTEINADVLAGCINKGLVKKQILSRKDVLSYCEDLENPVDQFTLLAIFEGIMGESFQDIVNLKMSDISRENGMYIAHVISGKDLPMSSQLHSYADLSNETFEYHPMQIEGKRHKLVNLVENGRIIKGNSLQRLEGKEIDVKRLYQRMKKVFAFLDLPYMRLNMLYISGQIHHINERAKEMGMSGRDYLYTPESKEFWKMYPTGIQVLSFIRQYGEVLG